MADLLLALDENVWDWLDVVDALLTPALLVLLATLTALWRYWRRERTRGRVALLVLVGVATLLMGVASLAPRLRLAAAGAAAALLLVAGTRLLWSWLSHRGRPEGLLPMPEPLETLQEIVLQRLHDVSEPKDLEQQGQVLSLKLPRKPPEPHE